MEAYSEMLVDINSSDSTFTTELRCLHRVLGATFMTESCCPRTHTSHCLGRSLSVTVSTVIPKITITYWSTVDRASVGVDVAAISWAEMMKKMRILRISEGYELK